MAIIELGEAVPERVIVDEEVTSDSSSGVVIVRDEVWVVGCVIGVGEGAGDEAGVG